MLTVTDVSTTCMVQLYSSSESKLYHFSWCYLALVIDLIGQLSCNVIGHLSVKPWCYWLWRLVISNWCISIRLLSQLNSRLWLWRWLPHRLSKRQSLSTTTFLFRTSSPGQSNSTYFWNDSWVQTFHIPFTKKNQVTSKALHN